MSDRLNILSIDWDYFINATMSERCSLFPDGGNENIPSVIQNTVWSGYYRTDSLKNIETDTQAIQKIKRCLRKSWDSVFMIADSHRHAYDFIKSIMVHMNRESVNVVNVDYHHDIYNNGEEVDCGNWLRKIMNDYSDTDSSFTWIAREDSDESGFCFDESVSDGDGLIKGLDIDYIFEYDWDAVFICKSGMWSPPHLDKKFKDAFKWILDDMPNTIKYEKGIFEDRFPNVEKEVNMYNMFYDKIKEEI